MQSGKAEGIKVQCFPVRRFIERDVAGGQCRRSGAAQGRGGTCGAERLLWLLCCVRGSPGATVALRCGRSPAGTFADKGFTSCSVGSLLTACGDCAVLSRSSQQDSHFRESLSYGAGRESVLRQRGDTLGCPQEPVRGARGAMAWGDGVVAADGGDTQTRHLPELYGELCCTLAVASRGRWGVKRVPTRGVRFGCCR